ncbi:DUF4349 domain-containing protein [candidate division KSB1 bacterium]|nr:DUF4349 domain-containing protein [candidate division KSB1 bacterium]
MKTQFLKVGALLLLFIGCGSREETQPVQVARMMMEAPESHSEAAGRFSQLEQKPIEALRPIGRLVIKTATISCEVTNYDEALGQIQKIVAQFGGYIIFSTTQVHENNVKSGSVSLRIDAKHFDTALQEIKKSARKVETESIQGNDVTEEFYDLTARLENKRKAEKRYQEILASAKTTKDILEVEQALTNVREEIERMEGRKRYLEDQIALSTITINLHEPYPLMASGRYGFLAQMRRGIENGVSGFSEVLSACITFAIAGIPLFVLLFILIWAFRRYRRKSKAVPSLKSNMAEKKE